MSILDGIAGRFGFQRAAQVPAAAALAPVAATSAANRRMVAMRALSARGGPQLATRTFKSAGSNRLTGGLPSVSMSPDQVSLQTLRTLRARSRWEIRNNDIAKRAISLYDTGVIGLGINLHGKIVDPNGLPDEAANQAIEQGWREWCRAGNCELTGKSFWAVQRLFERATIEDGEVLVRLHQGPNAGPWGFQIELIDAELLEVSDNRQLPNGNWVRMGIEYDSWRRPVAYWIVEPDQRTGLLSYGYAGRRALRVPALGMLHQFIPERVGETRGTPRLANCLMRLAHLEGAEDAALVALRIGAEKLGWMKYDETAQQYTGNDQGIEDPNDPNSPAHRIIDSAAGEFGELPVGVTLEKWEPNYPNNEYAPFQKRLMQNLGSGMDLPYFELGNDLEGVNYSSAKIGLMSVHDTYQAHQKYVIEGLCEPIFTIWLQTALLTGRLKFPGSDRELPLAKIDKFRNVRFQPRTWEGADLLKEVSADVTAVEAMQTTLTDVIRKRTGRDFHDVLKERQREIEAMTQAGIPQSPGLNEQLLKLAVGFASTEEKGNAQAGTE